jgi:[acyl-carrier-protein] S-malonyltransferase
LNSPQVAEPLLASIQIAYAQEMFNHGVLPDVIAGYSAGEVAAFFAAGVLSQEDALKAAVIRGSTLGRYTDTDSRMVAVARIPVRIVEEWLSEQSISVEIAAINAPDHLTLVGPRAAISACAVTLSQRGASISDVNVAGAWHSSAVRQAVIEVEAQLESLSFTRPDRPLYLSATGKQETNPEVLRHMLAAQIAQPVLWNQVVESWCEAGVKEFVEMGPGRVLLGLLRRCWPSHSDYQVTCVETPSGGTQPFRRLLTNLSI